MASVTVMRCPTCDFERRLQEGHEYTQRDLVCPADETDLKIATTYDDGNPPPALPVPAPAAPPDVPPLELLTSQMERIQELYAHVRSAQEEYDQKAKKAKTAKEDLERCKAALLVYIANCRTPTLLPLFDGAGPESTNELRLELAELGVETTDATDEDLVDDVPEDEIVG